jgi:hypothetical protein
MKREKAMKHRRRPRTVERCWETCALSPLPRRRRRHPGLTSVTMVNGNGEGQLTAV